MTQAKTALIVEPAKSIETLGADGKPIALCRTCAASRGPTNCAAPGRPELSIVDREKGLAAQHANNLHKARSVARFCSSVRRRVRNMPSPLIPLRATYPPVELSRLTIEAMTPDTVEGAISKAVAGNNEQRINFIPSSS